MFIPFKRWHCDNNPNIPRVEKCKSFLWCFRYTPPKLDMFTVVMLTFLIELHWHDHSKLTVLGTKMLIRSLTWHSDAPSEIMFLRIAMLIFCVWWKCVIHPKSRVLRAQTLALFPRCFSGSTCKKMALGIEVGRVFLTSSCGILRKLSVLMANILISFRKWHNDASFSAILMSFLMWNSNTSSTMMIHNSDTPIFFLVRNCGVHWKSSVPRIANLTSFLQMQVSLCCGLICFLSPSTTKKNLSPFFRLFDSFLYFASIGYRFSKVWIYGVLGCSAPHTDYILRLFGRTCCLQFRAEWIGSSLNNPVIILKQEAAISYETSEYLITTPCWNQKDNYDLNKNCRENLETFFQTFV
jgi:hypothetical protein